MKRIATYVLGLLLLAACSKEETLTPAQRGETGRLRMNIAATRTEGEGYDPMDHLTVRVYNAEGGLLRKYASREALPETLELLAGNYRVAVEAGEEVAASHEKRRYEGEQTFEIKPGGETPVEVLCTLRSTVVEVKFDERIAAEFDPGFLAWVAVGEEAAGVQEEDENVPELRFTADGRGYFTLPEGAEKIAWRFVGEHPEKGSIEKSGTMPLKTGGGICRYKLTFRFSEDLPGYVEGVAVTVEEPAEGEDDTLIFSPDPVIESTDFDIDALQQYVSGEKNYRIATMAPLARLVVSFDGTDYTVLGAGAAEVPGVALVQQSDTEGTLTLSEAFFAERAGGDHTVAVSVEDSDGGNLTCRTPYQLQGILPVGAEDCDLWSNSVTLRALAFDPAAEVRFFLRRAGGEWAEADGAAAADGGFTARFAAEWAESTNEAGLTVYTPVAGTGVFAAGSYECAVEIGGARSETAFETPCNQPIPFGDMEDSSNTCFSGSSESTIFWGSGNNDFASTLCSQTEMGGSKCAKLQSKAAGLAGFMTMLAAGNLFTGTFVKPSTDGTVSFGKDYSWQARPTALKLKYHATIGTVDYTKYKDESGNDPLAKGSQDKGRFYVAIIDWDTPHGVTSGTKGCSGMWDPATASSLAEGAILGYGSYWVEASTEGSELVDLTLPIFWYDKVTKPSKAYKIVISCSANAYGDYMNGCSSNVIYVDDFEWVY